MARRVLGRQKLKFFFPKKILWNPFAYLDRKAKKIPKNIILSFLFCAVALLLLRAENKRMHQAILGLQTRLKADSQEAFSWEQLLNERPDYRDGWIQLAAVYHKLGDTAKAKEALLRAKALDPTNETILSFEKLLENQ